MRFLKCLLFLLVTPALAQTVPSLMSYQGRLDSDGTAAPDGSYAMTFNLYQAPTGGSAVWSETNPAVQVAGGVFSVWLGSQNPLSPGVISDPMYLEIQVGGQVLSPRQRLASSPFALQAGSVAAGAITSAQLAPGSITGASLAAGSVTSDKVASMDYSKLTNVPAPPIGVGWFNVTNYGATGDGATDDGPAIRAAIAALQAQGGGTLYFPAGVYRGGVVGHPFNAAYQAVAIIPGNTRVLGDGKGATVIGLLPGQPDYARVFLNYQIASGGDENITIENLALDGFATDQSVADAQYGLFIMRARNLRVRNVQFRNFFGNASSGNGENFFCEFQLGTGASFTDCECVGSSGSSATGFSADGATDVTYVNCQSYGLTVSQAFTHNGCRHVTYIGCHAYLCPGGFNSEVSSDVTYSACTVGGYVTTSGTTLYPYPPNTPLGISGPYGGFVINGSKEVQIIGCNSIGNTNGSGVWVQGANSVLIAGGIFTSNKNYGIHIDSTSLPTTHITGRPNLNGNSRALDIPTYPGPIEGGLTNPGLPASGVALTNPYPMDVTVYIFGGAVTGILVDNKTTGLTSGTFHLPAGSSIKINYSSAPAWNWIAG